MRKATSSKARATFETMAKTPSQIITREMRSRTVRHTKRTKKEDG